MVILASALCVGHASGSDVALRNASKHVNKSSAEILSRTESGDFSHVSSSDSGSLKWFILAAAGYAIADYFEKVPKFLSIRHGMSLLRGKPEEGPTLQDVFNDFK